MILLAKNPRAHKIMQMILRILRIEIKLKLMLFKNLHNQTSLHHRKIDSKDSKAQIMTKMMMMMTKIQGANTKKTTNLEGRLKLRAGSGLRKT